MEQNKINYLLNRSLISTDISASPNLKLLQWNVLNPIYAKPEKYPNLDTQYLDFDYRKVQIKQEILQLDPDIVCLQEVNINHIPFYEEFLGEKAGYKYINTRRADGSDDSLLFAVRTTFIEILSTNEGLYINEETSKPHGQVYQIHLLKIWVDKEKDKCLHLMITNTHLKAKKECEHIRISQIKQLKQAITSSKKEFAVKFSIDSNDILEIVLGDFNDVATSEALSAFKEFSHLESAYEFYEFTKFHVRKKTDKNTIDYLFYSKKDCLKLIGYLDGVNSSVVPYGLPTKEFPSDHLYLYSFFSVIV